MLPSDQEDSRTYLVVVNAEEQYSIWPRDKSIPVGWSAVGKQGAKSECLQYIDQVWTDMRSLSLRQRMDRPEASQYKRHGPFDLVRRGWPIVALRARRLALLLVVSTD